MIMESRKPMLIADCPECEAPVRFERMPKLGLILVCSACSTRVEVIDLEPIELDWAIDMVDDDDDDGDYDDDFGDDYDYDDDYKKPNKGDKKRR
jgi:lysine biosynthesis protein LysW